MRLGTILHPHIAALRRGYSDGGGGTFGRYDGGNASSDALRQRGNTVLL